MAGKRVAMTGTATTGLFIAVDGIDGAGKTTLVKQLADLLVPLQPVVTREPTGESEWGRRLRRSATEGRLPRDTEIAYFHQDRLHHLETVVKPALGAGRLVITDRYVDSTLAFQARDPEEAQAMFSDFRPEIVLPDLTFILVCPVETGLMRIAENREKQTAFETAATLRNAAAIYQSRVGNAYVQLDAAKTVSWTLQQALQALRQHLPAFGPAIRHALSEILPRATIVE